MSRKNDSLRIVGQGLAGTCLAWALWKRGARFEIVDRGWGGSSRVAAGLVNPVTGKNFEPSWRIAEFLPEALEFYREMEGVLGQKIWHPMPVLRLAGSAKEWRKIERKLADTEVAPWVAGVVETPVGWAGAVELRGGGRVNVTAFLHGSRDFFKDKGLLVTGEFEKAEGVVDCRGAEALLEGCYGPQRCAKGEILTVRADWDEGRMRIGAGGWVVPVGGGLFRAGSTYEWKVLDGSPTAEGRRVIEEKLRMLAGEDFEVVDHVAGVRPILRRSMPLIGPAGGGWMFNGLGSKGSLYAPGMAERLARWICEGVEAEREVDVRGFLGEVGPSVIAPTGGATGDRPHSRLPKPTELAHVLLGGVISAGDVVMDATAGNGHDTLFLAERVGESGAVLAFDVQECAVRSAGERIAAAGLGGRVRFFVKSHAAISDHAGPGTVTAVMFNLGYLPGGDHGQTTVPQETVRGLEAAAVVLRPGGMLTVVVYPGHPGGAEEAATVEEWMEARSAEGWRVARYGALGTRRAAPFLLVGVKV